MSRATVYRELDCDNAKENPVPEIDVSAALEAGFLITELPPQEWLDLLSDQRLPVVIIRTRNTGYFINATIVNLQAVDASAARKARKVLFRETDRLVRSIPDCQFADSQGVRAIGPMSLLQAKGLSRTLLHRRDAATGVAA